MAKIILTDCKYKKLCEYLFPISPAAISRALELKSRSANAERIIMAALRMFDGKLVFDTKDEEVRVVNKHAKPTKRYKEARRLSLAAARQEINKRYAERYLEQRKCQKQAKAKRNSPADSEPRQE